MWLLQPGDGEPRLLHTWAAPGVPTASRAGLAWAGERKRFSRAQSAGEAQVSPRFPSVKPERRKLSEPLRSPCSFSPLLLSDASHRPPPPRRDRLSPPLGKRETPTKATSASPTEEQATATSGQAEMREEPGRPAWQDFQKEVRNKRSGSSALAEPDGAVSAPLSRHARLFLAFPPPFFFFPSPSFASRLSNSDDEEGQGRKREKRCGSGCLRAVACVKPRRVEEPPKSPLPQRAEAAEVSRQVKMPGETSGEVGGADEGRLSLRSSIFLANPVRG